MEDVYLNRERVQCAVLDHARGDVGVVTMLIVLHRNLRLHSAFVPD